MPSIALVSNSALELPSANSAEIESPRRVAPRFGGPVSGGVQAPGSGPYREEGMRVPKIGRRLRRVGLLVGLVAVLAACGNDNGQNSLHPKGPYAEKINNLFIPIVILAIVIGIAVLSATVVFALKFRYREGKPDNPRQIHGSTPLEIGWTIVPALILAVVAVPTIATIFDLAKK